MILESFAGFQVLSLSETWFFLLDRRFDILIKRKEVGRIIPVLEGNQPFVVSPVGGSHPSLPFIAQEVDIDSAAGKGLHGPPACTGPPYVLVCLTRFAVIPRGHHADHIGLFPQRKGSLGRADPARGTVDMLNQHVRPWRGAG